MDDREYYRLLGLPSNATRQEIESAYKEKMKKLKSEDYSDDPEYAAKRAARLRHAYSVLTGSSAPVTRAQEEARFERIKDALDGGEDTIEEAREELKRKMRKLKNKVSSSESEEERDDDTMFARREKSGGKTVIHLGKEGGYRNRSFDSAASSKGVGRKKLTILVIVFIAVSVIITAISEISNSYYEDSYNDYDSQEYLEDVHAAIDYIYSVNSEYNYERVLDTSVQEENLPLVQWDMTDSVYEQIWDCSYDLSAALQIYATSDAVEYITGDPDYYWEHDDLENGLTLASIMIPPSFEEIAGAVDVYNNEPILDYVDYFHFLTNVALNQTEFEEIF